MFKLERKARNHPWLTLLVGAGSFAALGLGTALLYYLRFGAGQANAPAIPDSIEGRLDAVVEALNRKFGKRWVNRGLSTLQVGLSTILPSPLVGLVEVVHRIEHLAEQKGWTSHDKRDQAAQSMHMA